MTPQAPVQPRLQPLLARLAATLRRLGTRRPRRRLAPAQVPAAIPAPPLFPEPRSVSEALTAYAHTVADSFPPLADWLHLQAARARRTEGQLDEIVQAARGDFTAVDAGVPSGFWVAELDRLASNAAEAARQGGAHGLA